MFFKNCLFFFSLLSFGNNFWEKNLSEHIALISVENLPVINEIKDKRLWSKTSTRRSKRAIYVYTEVETKNKVQKLNNFMSINWNASCQRVFQKIHPYESFSRKVGFIENSKFKKGILSLTIDHLLIPKLLINLKIERILSENIYEYEIIDGMYQGLRGKISFETMKNSPKKICISSVSSSWKGRPQIFSDFVFEKAIEILTPLLVNQLVRL